AGVGGPGFAGSCSNGDEGSSRKAAERAVLVARDQAISVPPGATPCDTLAKSWDYSVGSFRARLSGMMNRVPGSARRLPRLLPLECVSAQSATSYRTRPARSGDVKRIRFR